MCASLDGLEGILFPTRNAVEEKEVVFVRPLAGAK